MPRDDAGQDAARQISGALQSVWDAARAEHADLPAAVVTIQPPGPRRPPPAHNPAEWWTSGNAALVIPGRTVTGDGDPGHAAVHDVLHQAAHALAAVRGIADTSASSGLYHNLDYVAVAAQVGLAFPGPRPGRKKRGGYNLPPLTEAAAARPEVAAAVRAVNQAAQAYRDADSAARAGRGGQRLAAACECDPPRRLQVTPKQLGEGPIRCGNCGAAFRPGRSED
jgi:hypothetical protein